MSKHDPLRDYLKVQKHERISMSFAEIEKLGISLPASARKHRPWWANNRHHSQANSWLNAGYETEQVDMASQRLSFVKFTDLHSPNMESDDFEDINEEDDLHERLSAAEAKLASFECESSETFADINARHTEYERRLEARNQKTKGYLTVAGIVGFLAWVLL